MANVFGRAARRRAVAGRTRLRAEFAALYLAAPVAMAVLLPPALMFPALFAVTALGLALLQATPDFAWSELAQGAGRIGWGRVLGWTLATAGVGFGVVEATAPGALGLLLRERPGLILAIAALYPLLSALPQEIVFRPLFFRRYGRVLPRGTAARLGLNAAVFAFAHLMYWSWVVAAMTFAGGLLFAWSYAVRRNFPEALLLHALAGITVFALGLGAFFYSGNVARPF